MNTAVVDTSAIKVRKGFNIRSELDGIPEFSEQLKREGIHTALTVSPGDQPNTFVLVAGHRRLAAAELAGIAKVPVTIIAPKSEADARWANATENLTRHDVTSYDLAKFLAWCRETQPKESTGEKLAARLMASQAGEGAEGNSKYTEAHVNNLIRTYNALSPQLREEWRHGTLPYRDWLAIVGVAGEDHTKQAAEYAKIKDPGGESDGADKEETSAKSKPKKASEAQIREALAEIKRVLKEGTAPKAAVPELEATAKAFAWVLSGKTSKGPKKFAVAGFQLSPAPEVEETDDSADGE